MKTYVPKIDQTERKWYILDADDIILGRLASQAATLLRGKHKPEFIPHLDMGDHVIIINADKVRVTGRKSEQKTYKRYSGYPGGLRVQEYNKVLQTYPDRIIKSAIKGMLPKNRLGRKMIKKLKVYAGSEHPHAAQLPVELPSNLRRI